MEARPAVSVSIPCYNSADTLGFALASVRLQTFENWECVVVDDGSTDDPLSVIQTIGDPRIRYVRLRRNFGRGAARQTAMEASHGAFFTKLDADDWIYPTKLDEQLAYLEGEPSADVVSSPVTIVDQIGEILGLRGATERCNQLLPPCRGTSLSHIALQPVMIRAEIATRYRYDRRLRRSEDNDYMLQVLWQHHFAILRQPTYVYRMFQGTRKGPLLRGYKSRLRMLWKYRNRYPKDAWREMALSVLKFVAVLLLFDEQTLVRELRRRTPATSDCERTAYWAARNAVKQELMRLMGSDGADLADGARRGSRLACTKVMSAEKGKEVA